VRARVAVLAISALSMVALVAAGLPAHGLLGLLGPLEGERVAATSLPQDPLPKPRRRELHVMSYNILQSGGFGPTWESRRPALRALVRRERPHLIGTQEARRTQVGHILADLPRYRAIARSASGYDAAGSALFYDPERLRLRRSGVFALSDYPDRPGTSTWSLCCAKVVVWGRFVDRRTKVRFLAANTHFEALSPYARERSAALVRRLLPRLAEGEPIVLTGDFNDPGVLASPSYRILTETGWLRDAWPTARQRRPDFATLHSYRGAEPGGRKIDWILVSRGVRVRRTAVNVFHYGGLHPSDHFPVQTLVTLPPRRR